MSSPSAETGQEKKQWDIESVSIRQPTPAVNWFMGIDPAVLASLTERMEEAGVFTDATKKGDFNFYRLKALVKYLHENNYDTSDLKTSVETLLREDNKILVKKIQEAMKLLFHHPGAGQITIEVDGVWGPKSEEELGVLCNGYNLIKQSPGKQLLKILEAIAERQIRIQRVTDSLLPYNLFSVLTSDSPQYEINESGQDFVITKPGDQKQLVRFSSSPAYLAYDKICGYLFFLHISKHAAENQYVSVYSYKDDILRIQELLPQKPEHRFIINTDHYLEVDDQSWVPSLMFNHVSATDTELIAVYFTPGFTMRVLPLQHSSRFDHNTHDLMEFTEEAMERLEPLVPGTTGYEFIKIFVLRKDHNINTTPTINPTAAGIELDPVLYQLLSTSQEDILSTVTIGLHRTVKKKQTAKKEEEQEVKSSSTEQVKKKGLTREAFIKNTEKIYKERPVTVTDDPQKNRWSGNNINNGKILRATVGTRPSVSSSFPISLSVTNQSTTEHLSGYVAFFLHNSYEEEIEFVMVRNGVARLTIRGDEAFTVGAYCEDGTVLELDLNQQQGYPPDFYYPEPSAAFKEVVKSVYTQQAILVPEDLQKKRWGGSSEENGIVMNATVVKTNLKRWFDITVSIDASSVSQFTMSQQSNQQPLLTQQDTPKEVALFLHNSFGSEILYDVFVKGKARFTIHSYEAFTLGAYTDTGIMLELDLNEVEGYPNDFYYDNVTDAFMDQVQNFYTATPPNMGNDLQRDRWSKKRINKGKQLTASFVHEVFPGQISVELNVSSENRKKKLTGEVAFFVSPFFGSEILYKKVVDGVAKITLTCSKAFAVGAFTSDGTVLELDLNDIKGFPDSFYSEKKTSNEKEPEPQANPAVPNIKPSDSKQWSNGSGNFIQTVGKYFEITNGNTGNKLNDYNNTTAALQDFILRAIEDNKSIRAIGAGWSFSKVVATDGWLLSTHKLNIFFELSTASIATQYKGKPEQLFFAQCGCTVKELNIFLKEHNKSLKTSPASNAPTIAGLISTGSHGSAIDVGSIQDFVTGLHIIVAPDKHIYLERASYPVVSDSFISQLKTTLIRDDELFNAALVSFGCFGIIHGVMIETEEQFVLEAHRSRVHFDAALETLMNTLDFSKATFLPKGTERPYHFQVFLDSHDNFRHAIVTTMYKRPYTSSSESLGVKKVVGAGDDGSGFLAKTFSDSLRPIDIKSLIRDGFPNFSNSVGTISELFNNETVRVDLVSIAIGIPINRVMEVTNILKPLIDMPSFGGLVSYRYVKASKALLAFTKFETTCCIIELDTVAGTRIYKILKELCDILDKTDIPYTFHWGKLNDLNGPRLEKMYGANKQKWVNARARLLPPRSLKVFSNKIIEDWGLDTKSGPDEY